MSFQQRHEVLFLNNTGASHLRNGEIDNAMNSLTQALAAVRQCGEVINKQGGKLDEYDTDEELDLEQYFCNIIEWSSSSSDCESTAAAASASDFPVCSTHHHQQHQPQHLQQHNPNSLGHATSRTSSGFSDSNKGLYVYSSPLELPIDDDMSIAYKVQCITILFNLGLCFQLKAYQEEEDQRQWGYPQQRPSSFLSSSTPTIDRAMSLHMYENAIALYELCYDVLNGGASPTASSSSGTKAAGNNCGTINPGLHFIMILTNNLGQCHYSLHNHEKSRTCFEQLLSIQMYVVDSFGGDCDGIETANGPAVSSSMDTDGDTSMMAVTATADSSNTTTNSGGRSHPTSSMKYNSTSCEVHTSTTNLTPWEGFLNNTSRIVILSKRCASAA